MDHGRLFRARLAVLSAESHLARVRFGLRCGDRRSHLQLADAYGTPAPDTPFYGTINLVERQFALFGEATYSILPRLDLTLGARYFDFKDDFDLYFTGVAGAIEPGEPDTGNGQQSSKGVNPRGVLTFKVNDQVIVYGEAARGFRYGGVNEPAPVIFCQNDLEAMGLKESPAILRAGSSVELYARREGHIRRGPLEDERRRLLHRLGRCADPASARPADTSFAQNAGKITSQGLEWESKRPRHQRPHARPQRLLHRRDGERPHPQSRRGSGDRAPFFPRNIVTASGDYDIPLPQGKIEISADYTYRSRRVHGLQPGGVRLHRHPLVGAPERLDRIHDRPMVAQHVRHQSHQQPPGQHRRREHRRSLPTRQPANTGGGREPSGSTLT